MTRNAHRKFIAAIVSTAMLVTGISAAPARADTDDLAKALAAIVGVAIIGSAINNRKHRKEDAQRARQAAPVQRRYVDPGYRVQPRPLPRRVARKLLPGQCLRTFNTRRGTLSVFGERCLQNNYRHVNRLPSNCYRTVRTRNGQRRGYEAQCLRSSGYKLARR
ncbi:MAG: hypothetical protein WBC93_10145 [Sulfitobacter sp.]